VIWAVYCLDAHGVGDARAHLRAQHSAHLRESPVRLLLAGPLTDDDGDQSVGSLMVFEADARGPVQDHLDADPFFTGGIWASVEIRAFNPTRGALIAGATTSSA